MGEESDTSGAVGTGETDELASVAAVLDDPHARAILVHTARAALSADDLAERIDGSRSTVYRRARRLVELDLVAESREIDPDGNHFTTYRARLDRVTIDLDTDGFAIDVDRRPIEDDAVDRLNRLFERLNGP
ncbi:winged helix-turn-helix domain-containing protein [Halobaculum limi]|uniref:winged helix-turn-helix domain-containing protein n=1 Tax=Halobaculum limi TaxID=3031916 RepID=UPI0024059D5D|nr:winged helix-turn-helix domain-containing protein [Halobaculum sp. YSMS11]